MLSRDPQRAISRLTKVLTPSFFSPLAVLLTSAHQTKWLELCFPLATGWQLHWGGPEARERTQASLSFSGLGLISSSKRGSFL